MAAIGDVEASEGRGRKGKRKQDAPPEDGSKAKKKKPEKLEPAVAGAAKRTPTPQTRLKRFDGR